MKGAIYQGIKNIELKELPMPNCDDNGIVVKNLYAAICGSDVTAYNHGGRDNMIFEGLEFGHEMISEVVKVGKNVQGIKVGDRVFPTSFAKADIMRAATIGGFSEYIEIPQCVVNQSVYIVSDKIENKIACLIEPFTIGARAVLHIGTIEKGKNAIVFGAGAIGLTAAMTLKYLGANVCVVDLSESRLNIAKQLGMEICDLSKENYLEKCGQLFGTLQGFMGTSIDVDYYVDAAGNQAVIDSFFSGAKPTATLAVVAVHHKPITLNMIPITYNGLRIVGTSGLPVDAEHLVLEILESHQFDVEKLITHEFTHENIIEAFETASNPKEALKVVIRYE